MVMIPKHSARGKTMLRRNKFGNSVMVMTSPDSMLTKKGSVKLGGSPRVIGQGPTRIGGSPVPMGSGISSWFKKKFSKLTNFAKQSVLIPLMILAKKEGPKIINEAVKHGLPLAKDGAKKLLDSKDINFPGRDKLLDVGASELTKLSQNKLGKGRKMSPQKRANLLSMYSQSQLQGSGDNRLANTHVNSL